MCDRGTILVVDDEAAAIANRIQAMPPMIRVGITVCSPEEMTARDLDDADLVLVDYKLDHWLENLATGVLARTVPNGIALTALLQQQMVEHGRPRAFALHSQHLFDLTAPFPPEQRVHLLARTYNVEWAFVKNSIGETSSETLERAHILADAVAVLPDNWPREDPDRARDIAKRLLAVPLTEPWGQQTWEEVEMAYPPLDELTLRIHGILFVRWLLTRVLYYPCFMLDRYWVAARLGATPTSVDAALSGSLGDLLRRALLYWHLAGVRRPTVVAFWARIDSLGSCQRQSSRD